MAVYDVVALKGYWAFDPYKDLDYPMQSYFVNVSANLGSPSQPKTVEKSFAVDRDNLKLPNRYGGFEDGEWMLSKCPGHIRKKDPYFVWKYLVEHVPQGQGHLALKMKVWEDCLDYYGKPRWELVYVKPSTRVTQLQTPGGAAPVPPLRTGSSSQTSISMPTRKSSRSPNVTSSSSISRPRSNSMQSRSSLSVKKA